MRLAIITDAWLPQVNGVVATLQRTRGVLEARGHAVKRWPAERRSRLTP
jgi:hypothetical protein